MTPLEISVRRALEARELRAGEIAAHCGCSREYVARVAAKVRRELRPLLAAIS